MQKNKIDLVKAVRNSVARKLVAICLAMAVGGTVVIDGNYGFVANAQGQEQPQDQEEMERERLIDRLWELEAKRRVLEPFHDNDFVGWRIAIALTMLEGEEDLDEIRNYIDEEIAPFLEDEEMMQQDLCCLCCCWLPREFFATQRSFLYSLCIWSAKLLEKLYDNVRFLITGRRPRLPEIPRSPRGSSAPVSVIRRGEHFTAGENSHVHSVSDHDLTHEGAGAALITGPGPVDIDDGEITISECNDDLSRNVTVNSANSLTIAPHVNVNLRNGTEFETGETGSRDIEQPSPSYEPTNS